MRRPANEQDRMDSRLRGNDSLYLSSRRKNVAALPFEGDTA